MKDAKKVEFELWKSDQETQEKVVGDMKAVAFIL